MKNFKCIQLRYNDPVSSPMVCLYCIYKKMKILESTSKTSLLNVVCNIYPCCNYRKTQASYRVLQAEVVHRSTVYFDVDFAGDGKIAYMF